MAYCGFVGKASEQALTEAMDHKNEPGNFYHGMCYPFLLPVKSCTRSMRCSKGCPPHQGVAP
ncbi:unnamed protein product [Ixodes persulcatus]